MKPFNEWKIREGDVLYNQGVGSLSNSGLLTYLFKDHRIADRLLNKYKTLRKIYSLNPRQLEDIIGLSHTESLLSSFELGKRLVNSERDNHTRVSTSRDVYDLFRNEMGILNHEELKTVLLNSKNDILESRTISQGDIDGASIYPRKIFNYAITSYATGIILLHNHPTGDPKPSANDEYVTKTIIGGGKLLNIDLVDHVIIGDNRYYSFKDSRCDMFR